MITCKAYDETTADDFRRLFQERFSTGNAEILERMASNPLRSSGTPMGRIAYDDAGRPVAIQGLLPRRAYCGQTAVKVGLAMVMAVAKDVDRSFLTPFLKETMEASGADLIFGNTAIPGSRKRLQAAVNVQDGPASCSMIRERTLRGDGAVARLFRRLWKFAGRRGAARTESAPYRTEIGDLTLSRETTIDGRDFDSFWERYLEKNEGLVSSRTAEELKWMFGSGLMSGEIVLLTARRTDGLAGYVFLHRTDETAVCWRIADLIALKNDETVLLRLVEAASEFLYRRTPATCLQVTGFPMRIQPFLRRLFPKESTYGFNKCIWTFPNESTASLCGDWVNAPNGWYGCPYDGDMCLV